MESSEPPASSELPPSATQEEQERSLDKNAWEIVGNTTQSQSLIRGYTLEDTSEPQSDIRGYTLENQEKSEVGYTTMSKKMDTNRGYTLENSTQIDEETPVAGQEKPGPNRGEESVDVLIGGLTEEAGRSPIALLTDMIKTTSPTTSTPGSTPSSKGSKEDLFGETCRDEGEMSAIRPNEEEDDDIEIIKEDEEVESTLNGKSVDYSYIQAASDSAWRSLDEGEDEERIDPQSCIARRTRSHTEGIRKMETSLFYGEDEDSFVEGIIDSRVIMDSFNIKCKNKEEWRDGIKKLSDTLEYAQDAVDIVNRTLELVDDIKKEVSIVPDDDIEIVEIEREEDKIERKKKVTFYIEKANCANAIENVTKALENISKIDSDTLPRRYLEGIIRILVTICMDSNYQMQVAQRTIGAMSEVIEDLLSIEEKSKKTKKENRRLHKVIEELKSNAKHWSKKFDKMLEFTKPENKHRDAIKELIEIKITVEEVENRITGVRAKLADRNEKYNKLWEYHVDRKNYIKDLEKKMDLQKEKEIYVEGLR